MPNRLKKVRLIQLFNSLRFTACERIAESNNRHTQVDPNSIFSY